LDPSQGKLGNLTTMDAESGKCAITNLFSWIQGSRSIPATSGWNRAANGDKLGLDTGYWILHSN
jgi:hypothetical protein